MDLTWDTNPSSHYNFIVSNLISYSYILYHYLVYNHIRSSVISQSSLAENRKSFYLPVDDLNLSNTTNQREIMIYKGMEQ